MPDPLTDWSNTYGVKAWLPWRRERICREWVFFIDAFVVLTNTITVLLMAWYGLGAGAPLWWLAGANLCTLATYWCVRAWLRERAGHRAPEGTLSLVPSALWPHRYHGCRLIEQGEAVELFEWDGLRSLMRGAPRRIALCDVSEFPSLMQIPEFELMRGLSPAYFAVEKDEHHIVCKDLRTRNFATTFGQLDLCVDTHNQLSVERWHV